MNISSRPQNRLLTALAQGGPARLPFGMREVSLNAEEVLFEAGAPIDRVYFPLSGIASLLVVGTNGSDVEVATIGNEGLLGLGGLMSGDVSFSRQVVQMPGQGVVIERAPFLIAVNESRRLRGLLAAHTDAFAAQLMQSAACNVRHDAEQRLARWLLTVTDRSGLSDLPFTHHAVAEMLGVQRPTITLVARVLQSSGIIDYRRGTLRITDRAGLEDIACECYGIIKRAYDHALRATD